MAKTIRLLTLASVVAAQTTLAAQGGDADKNHVGDTPGARRGEEARRGEVARDRRARDADPARRNEHRERRRGRDRAARQVHAPRSGGEHRQYEHLPQLRLQRRRRHRRGSTRLRSWPAAAATSSCSRPPARAARWPADSPAGLPTSGSASTSTSRRRTSSIRATTRATAAYDVAAVRPADRAGTPRRVQLGADSVSSGLAPRRAGQRRVGPHLPPVAGGARPRSRSTVPNQSPRPVEFP